MAKHIFLIVLTIVVLLVPASVFGRDRDTSREIINNSFDLDEVLQTQESKVACEEYHRLVNEINGRTGEKIRSTVLEPCENLWEIRAFTVHRMPWRRFKTYVFGAIEHCDEAGLAFADAGLIKPDDPGFPVGIPQVRRKNQSLELPPEDPEASASCAMCHFSQLDDGRYSFGSGSSDIVFGKLASVFSYPLWIFDQKQ